VREGGIDRQEETGRWIDEKGVRERKRRKREE
jgi:hypothetical protein